MAVTCQLLSSLMTDSLTCPLASPRESMLSIFLIFSHFSRNEMVPHRGLNLHFPDDLWVEHFFTCLLAIYISPSVKYLFITVAHFVKVVLSFIVDSQEFFTYFEYVLCHMYCKYFCQSVDCLVTFLMMIFNEQKFLIYRKYNGFLKIFMK